MGKSSGGLGFLGLLGAVILCVVLGRAVPSLGVLLLIVAGVIAVGIAALVVLSLVSAFRQPEIKNRSKSQKKAKTTPEAKREAGNRAALLAKGRNHLLELRQLTLRVRDPQVRGAGEKTCHAIEKVLNELNERPEDLPKARQLFNYYLPTLDGILQRFLHMEQSGVSTGDTAEKVISGLNGIQAAMEKLYTSLFEDDKLDLTVEIETLKQICRQDGLLAEDVVQKENGEQNITLSL